jgi:putative oxidoreductase
VPYALPHCRFASARHTVFWNPPTKLANWDTTIELFTDEYKVPLLPP